MTMLTRLKRDLTMAETVRTPGGARVDLLVVADMVAPGARVLDVAAATASCCGCWRGDAPVVSEVGNPSPSRQDAPSRYHVGGVACRSDLPRERFSPLALLDVSLAARRHPTNCEAVKATVPGSAARSASPSSASAHRRRNRPGDGAAAPPSFKGLRDRATDGNARLRP
jgi:hypothetical protein